jgi:signal transduction histidine kinase
VSSGASNAALLRPVRLTYRLLLQVAVTALGFAVFWLLQTRDLSGARPVLVFPVIAAGLLFGWRGGLLGGIVTVPLAIGIVILEGQAKAITPALVAFGGAAIIAVGTAVGWMTDLTYRLRRTQSELLESQKRHLQATMEAQFLRATRLATLGSLARGVAHEINNPLAYLTSNLHSIRRALSGPSLSIDEMRDVHDALSESIEGAERIAAIVRSIRVFSSRSDADQVERLHVRAVAATAMEAVSSRLRSRAAVTCDIEGEPVVLGNAERLGQVLMHLLVNAAESIAGGHPESNRVTVTAARAAASTSRSPTPAPASRPTSSRRSSTPSSPPSQPTRPPASGCSSARASSPRWTATSPSTPRWARAPPSPSTSPPRRRPDQVSAAAGSAPPAPAPPRRGPGGSPG